MAQINESDKSTIAPWHRNLLIAGAVFSVLLIAMGAYYASLNPSATAPIGRDASAALSHLRSLARS